MDKPKGNLDFVLMSLTYRIRDCFSPRAGILSKIGIKPGFTVLAYGCGPGSYSDWVDRQRAVQALRKDQENV